jgi:GT2 family glycosyltransferase/glycosyltransferase involved in cell wall biosynthesis
MIPNLEKAVLFEPRHLPESAWLGHIPFACWLINTMQPRTLVELGAERGASYFAFCQAVSEAKLMTQAYALDTWHGDIQTGGYDESVFAFVEGYNKELYADFSKLLRGRFDEHLSQFDDASIDVLHIDGLHTYEAVRHDFYTWLPKVSPSGLVLLHDTEVDKPDFGVGKLLAELSTMYPVFRFTHSNGLGLVAVGNHVPKGLEPLFASPQCEETRQAFGELFAKLGAKWQGRKQHEIYVKWAEESLAWHKTQSAQKQLWPGSLTRRAKEALLKRGFAGFRDGLAEWVGRKRLALRTTLSLVKKRNGRSTLPGSGKVVIFSGEPDTPGHVFRVARLASAMRALSLECTICRSPTDVKEVLRRDRYDFLWVWRAPYSSDLEDAVFAARSQGSRIIYDCDDLMFEPELATKDVIDAIRSKNYNARAVARHYKKVRQAMLLADGLAAPTRTLARAMRRHFRSVFVLPNTFDVAAHDASSTAYLRRGNGERQADNSPVVRIGYASGTLTHQKDFLCAVDAVAACLRENPSTRLVLFRSSEQATLDVAEFPQLQGLEAQIEWREFVPMELLPSEMARFDINIAPLEHGNTYVEAKSELKYFDAALVRVPTVASPTQPYCQAIQHGLNGFLAETPDDWKKCLNDLIANAGLRREVGSNAYFHALAKYGPLAKARSLRRTLSMMGDSSHQVAVNFQAEIAEQTRQWTMPVCAESDPVFVHADGRQARAAVVMPLYNYEKFVAHALESVLEQSLPELELIVVDDASTDDSLRVASGWMATNRDRFCRAVLMKNRANSGLGSTRNRAIAEASALFVMPLDADNKLDQHCVERLLEVLQSSDAALAYPIVQHFGQSSVQMGYHDWHPMLFSGQNYIDAMAMLNKSAWSDVGGYDAERTGWEDYDFNCRLVEAGYWGQNVPAAHAFYRVHGQSMLRTLTESGENASRIAARYRELHPWLDIAGY